MNYDRKKKQGGNNKVYPGSRDKGIVRKGIGERDKAKVNTLITLIRGIRKLVRNADDKKRDYFYMSILPQILSILFEIYDKLKIFNKREEVSMAGKKKEELKKTESLLKKCVKISTTFVQTGSVILDALLGSGIALGTITLISGPSGIGKSTLLLYLCKSFCVQNHKVLFLDFENAVTESLLQGIGLEQYQYDPDKNPDGKFFLTRVRTFSEGESAIKEALDNGEEFKDLKLVVIDSATAMRPEKCDGKSVEEAMLGIQARLMAEFLSKLKGKLASKGVALVMSNQMRTRVQTGNIPTTYDTAGGNGLRFFPDTCIRLNPFPKEKLEKKQKTAYGDMTVTVGSICEIWCTKSRTGISNVKTKIYILFGKGISNNYTYKDYLEYYGAITKNGSWHEVKINGVQGKVHTQEDLIKWIQDNKSEVRNFLHAHGGIKLIQGDVVVKEIPDNGQAVNNIFNFDEETESKGLEE